MNTPIDLVRILTENEDRDSAITVYKECNHIISKYEEVKAIALSLAQSSLTETGEAEYKTVTGSCGWSNPKTPKLDKEAWQVAVSEKPELNTVQAHFNQAEKLLKKAQEAFMKLPAPTFFIR